jgi:hypothetical protein
VSVQTTWLLQAPGLLAAKKLSMACFHWLAQHVVLCGSPPGLFAARLVPPVRGAAADKHGSTAGLLLIRCLLSL